MPLRLRTCRLCVSVGVAVVPLWTRVRLYLMVYVDRSIASGKATRQSFNRSNLPCPDTCLYATPWYAVLSEFTARSNELVPISQRLGASNLNNICVRRHVRPIRCAPFTIRCVIKWFTIVSFIDSCISITAERGLPAVSQFSICSSVLGTRHSALVSRSEQRAAAAVFQEQVRTWSQTIQSC